jgi:hypothetical protein
MAAHVFYELTAGVRMPLAFRIGPQAASAVFGVGGVVVFRQAGPATSLWAAMVRDPDHCGAGNTQD